MSGSKKLPVQQANNGRGRNQLRVLIFCTGEANADLIADLLSESNDLIVEEYSGDASNIARGADVAVLFTQERQLSRETLSHAIIANLMGVPRIVLALDTSKSEGVDATCETFHAIAEKLNFQQISCIPVGTRAGANPSNLVDPKQWQPRLTLREYLASAEVKKSQTQEPFRMLVRSLDTVRARELAGSVLSGNVRVGQEVAVLPSGKTATVESIDGLGEGRDYADAGDTITIRLDEYVDISPRSILSALRDRPQVADQFAAHLIWLSSERLLPGRAYHLNFNGRMVDATVTELKYQVDVETLAKLAAKTLGPGEVGICNVSLAQPTVFDSYANNRATGSFVLLDRDRDETVAVGLVDFVLRRATNIHHQNITVSKAQRAAIKQHQPAVLWFTGLPSAGKSTIANLVEAELHARGTHTILLDGDNIRHGINRDLGFTPVDRVENIRRIGEVAKLMTDAGLIVLCAFISPFRAERRMVRELLGEAEFFEIFVDTPLDECISRDPKGLYARALAGEIKNFTGVDQAYEAPKHPEVHLKSERRDAQSLAHDVIVELTRRNIIS